MEELEHIYLSAALHLGSIWCSASCLSVCLRADVDFWPSSFRSNTSLESGTDFNIGWQLRCGRSVRRVDWMVDWGVGGQQFTSKSRLVRIYSKHPCHLSRGLKMCGSTKRLRSAGILNHTPREERWKVRWSSAPISWVPSASHRSVFAVLSNHRLLWRTGMETREGTESPLKPAAAARSLKTWFRGVL